MAQIFSGNGFKPDVSSTLGAGGTKGIVGKEEALRMEAEALASLQREKRNSLPVLSSAAKLLTSETQRPSSTSKPERDLIVFPESEAKKRGESNVFRDIDVEKLTKEELEKLLLDDFAAASKATRPSSLLGCSLSASYPGSQTFTASPLQRGPWTPSGSTLPTLTHPQAPVFPSAPFPKQPCSFQNGFSHGMVPFRVPERFFLSLPTQAPFMAFSPLPPTSPLVFSQPAVSPEMAKLFDKIASTSEYLKNGRSTSADSESAAIQSLAPEPLASEPTGTSRMEWLDLDPLSKPKTDSQEPPSCEPVEGGPAGDPWDAVLLDEVEDGGGGSPPAQERSQHSSTSLPRRASAGAGMTRSHSVNIPTTSSQHSQNNQCDKGEGKKLMKSDALREVEAQNQEVVAFCEDVAMLRSKFPHNDLVTNPGYVLSPVIPQRDMNSDNTSSVKVSIEISDSQEPVTFTCDVSSPVELLIMQALCWVHDDLNQVDIGSYILKVCGQEEVLQNKHSLGSHEYVQNCRKWEMEIKLQLLCQSFIHKDLARTAEDDSSPIDLERYLHQVERPFKETVTRAPSTKLWIESSML
ncbi:hypothetical protein MATL_G00099160 [Megalops atlanticus]|uniref:PI3K-RBD domain-containing protein n=1 Tax=Megalops atlanticus TaxID=7932 RepID=A0A9D3T6Q9_MEGAT|nr:hypothetical protein MATL_G00099160 [Megalops atlanticus]